MTEDTRTPLPVAVGFAVEYQPHDPVLYSLEDFRRETYAHKGRIRGLFTTPQPECDPKPFAYRGDFGKGTFCRAKHYEGNKNLSQMKDAIPLFIGPVMLDPDEYCNLDETH